MVRLHASDAGAQVQSLVGEQGFHMLQGANGKMKKAEKALCWRVVPKEGILTEKRHETGYTSTWVTDEGLRT